MMRSLSPRPLAACARSVPWLSLHAQESAAGKSGPSRRRPTKRITHRSNRQPRLSRPRPRSRSRSRSRNPARLKGGSSKPRIRPRPAPRWSRVSQNWASQTIKFSRPTITVDLVWPIPEGSVKRLLCRLPNRPSAGVLVEMVVRRETRRSSRDNASRGGGAFQGDPDRSRRPARRGSTRAGRDLRPHSRDSDGQMEFDLLTAMSTENSSAAAPWKPCFKRPPIKLGRSLSLCRFVMPGSNSA